MDGVAPTPIKRPNSDRIISNLRPKKALTFTAVFAVIILGIATNLTLQQNKNRNSHQTQNVNTISVINPFGASNINNPITPSITQTTIASSKIGGNVKFAADIITGTDNSYLLSIVDTHSKTLLHQKTFALSSFGWAVTIPDNSQIFYNTQTQQIIIPLIATSSAANTLPQPPFTTAIYSTTFDNVQSTKIFSTNEYKISTAVLDTNRNQLIMNDSTTGPNNERILTISLKDGTQKLIGNIQLQPQKHTGTITYGSFLISPDNNSVYQQIQYSDNSSENWAVDLINGTVNTINP